MARIKRINFFEDLGDKRATIAYFLQEGPSTCNAACKGCYAGAGQISFPLARGIISSEEAERDIAALVKDYRVLLRGTEILLNPNYIPLLKLADNRIVLTNGIILGQFPERLNTLAKNGVTNIVVTYPFDTNPSTIRNLGDLLQKRALIRLGIQNIKKRGSGFVLQLSTIITSDCLEDSILERIYEEAKSLGAEVIRFIPYVAMNGNDDVDCYALSKGEKIRLVEQIKKLKQNFHQDILCIHTPGVLGLFDLRASQKEDLDPNYHAISEKLICPAGLSYFAVSSIKKQDEKKRLYRPITPCHFRMDAEVGRYYGGLELVIDSEEVKRLLSGADRSDCTAANYWFNKQKVKKNG